MHRVPIEFVAGVDERGRSGRLRPRRRSLLAVGALSLGFLVSRECPGLHPVAWFALSQAMLAAVLLTSGVASRVLIFGAALAFGGGWFAMRIHESRIDTVTHIMTPLGIAVDPIDATSHALVQAHGIVLEPPQPTQGPRGELARYFHWSPSVRLSIAASRLTGPGGSVGSGGTMVVFITVPEGTSASSLGLNAGDTVRITGRFAVPEPPLNPGEPDKRLYAGQDGLIGRLHVPDASLVETVTQAGEPATLGEKAVSVMARVQAAMRLRARAALSAALPIRSMQGDGSGDTRDESGRALLIAMLLGEREVGYEHADEAFRRLGLVHLVAISGFNLAILAGLVLFMVRLTGDRGRIEPLIVAMVVAAYMMVVPAEAPVLRSGVTVLLFLAAEASGRRYDRLGMLGWIAALLILWRPMDLWSLGFQLSFGIVATLLWLGRYAEARLFGVPLRGVVRPARSGLARIIDQARDVSMASLRPLISSSLLAWAVAAPTIALHTGNFSPLAAITSIIVLPLSVVVLCAGYVVLAIGVVLPGAGAWTGGLLGWLGDLLIGTVFRLDDLPAMAVAVPRFTLWWSFAATTAVLTWFRFGRARDVRLRRIMRGATLLLALWLGLEMYVNTRVRSGTLLRIDTLAVGDGTCHLIRSAGDAMLWDCGSSMSGFGVRSLPRAVRELGAWHVGTVIITHANLDHFSSLLDAAGVLGVREVYICEAFKANTEATPRSADAALLRGLAEKGIQVRVVVAGDVLHVGEAELRFLSPAAGATFSESNDTSLIGLFSVPTDLEKKQVLFTGDAGVAAIRDVRARYPNLHADILELPHHGSFNHESVALVSALDPTVVLQSTGPRRAGDPRWDVAREGRTWLTTAIDGAAWVEIQRHGAIRQGGFADRR
ncbi:MAG: ComEC/Rec2 family competence protein [Pyrinomonadaceae bacterium]|nr:ComEC/Rec2 family competence protein [Phycisphaerales bacterium]